MITYKTRIDVNGSKTLTADLVFTSGDTNAYRLCFFFYDGNKPYDITGCQLAVKARRTDGVVITDMGTIEDGDCYYDVKSNMYAVPGEVYLEIALSAAADESYITTKEICFEVREGFGDGDLSADNTTPILGKLLAAASEAASTAEKAENIAETAAESLQHASEATAEASGAAQKAETAADKATAAAQSAQTAKQETEGATLAANGAAAAANTAATAANAAAARITTPLQADNISYTAASSHLSSVTVQGALDELSRKLYAVAGLSEVTWANVQKLVRAGLAPQVFSVGDRLICNHTRYGEMVWDIIDFDHDVPTDTAYTHSMSLQLHSAGQSLQFDAREALYYAENGLAAGTYHFTVPAGYDATHGGDGKSYQFTLTKAVPAGGQIEFGWAFNKDASTARLYTVESPSVVIAIENVAVSEGSGGTALTVLNNFDPARFGSERWSQSCARQWLNADGAAGAWWTAQHDYDRPYSADLTNKAGFLNGMDADFLAVIGTVTKRTALCEKIYGKNTYEDLPERVFLPSCSEIYSVNSTAVDEGAPYAYYLDNSTLSAPGAGADANRMKYKKDGTAAYWWLRTPRRDNPSFPHLVMPNGSVINGAFAYNSQYMMPVCNVI